MPTLENQFHENYAKLVANGMSKLGALRQLSPRLQHPKGQLSNFRQQHPEVEERIVELRMELACRAVMHIEEKRDVLRRMIEGTIPTKVVKTPKGVEAHYDRLAALQLDAKIAGELASDRLTLNANPASDLTLVFEMHHRDANNVPVKTIEAELIPEPSVKELEVNKALSTDLSFYEDSPMPKAKDAPRLSKMAKIIREAALVDDDPETE